MDTRSIFLDYDIFDGVTEDISHSTLLDWCYLNKNRILGKSGIHKIRLKVKSLLTRSEIAVKSLPRKTSKDKYVVTVPQTNSGG